MCVRYLAQVSLNVGRKDHDSILHDLPEATSLVKLRELGSAHFFERTADNWRRIHRIQCHDLLVHRYPKRRRVVGGTYRWRNHRCSRCDCFASDIELALGLDTACGRLGRLSHLLVPLVIREGRVVSAPNKALQLTADPFRGPFAAELGR